MMIENNLDEAEHVAELRRQLRRFVAEKAPRERRRHWDRTHTWPARSLHELARWAFVRLRCRKSMASGARTSGPRLRRSRNWRAAGRRSPAPSIHCAFYGGMNIAENGRQ